MQFISCVTKVSTDIVGLSDKNIYPLSSSVLRTSKLFKTGKFRVDINSK